MITQPPAFTLPETITRKQTLTYTVPHILIGIDVVSGARHAQVREGGNQQVEYTITNDYSFEPVPDEPTFITRATNQINFALQTLDVLNDATTIDGAALPASNPSASEYMAQLGKPTLLFFECVRDAQRSKLAGKDVFRTTRSKINLV